MDKQREKLVELITKGSIEFANSVNIGGYMGYMANYLLANGVIVPPCKVGDTAYHLTSIDTLNELNVAEIFEGKVCSISKDEKTLWIFCHYDNGLNFWYTERDIGRKLFLSREDAEKALKGVE